MNRGASAFDMGRSAFFCYNQFNKAELIQKDWIKQGAVVVDAGFHPRDGGGVGDIQLVGIEDVASAYTPVPGGVGPMTITTLIRQTVEAAEKALG